MASYLFCCFLLQLSFGAVLTGTEKLAYSGMSFKLLTNLTFQNHMTLYRNGNEESEFIATWEVINATITPMHVNPKYTGKIFMEIDKTPFILICNVDQTLSAKYIVIYDKDTAGPEVELKIIENKQLDVCLNSPPNSTEKYYGNVTGEQIQQDVRKWLADHPEYIKEYLGSWNPLFLGLLIVTCITGMLILINILLNLCIQPTDRIKIREGLINTKDWIQKKLCCKHKFENEPRESKVTVIEIEKTELKEDQVHKWLNDHPDFMDKYLGKLTEDQICMQIEKWEDAYPGLFKNKDLDAHENDRVVTPTLDELSVILTQHSGTGIEDNTNQSVSTQEIFNAYQNSDTHENDHQAIAPILNESSARLTQQSGTGIEGNPNQSVSTQEMFNASQLSDEIVKYDTATNPTLIELAVTLRGTEDNQVQLESSQEDVISTTYSSRSSGTFSGPDHSGAQPFNYDEQDANSEQDMAHDVGEVKEDSDTEDKCQEPLLTDHAKM